MNAQPLTLSVQEAAAALGVGKNTAYDLVRSGTLPHVRIGRTIRVPAEALKEWITSNTQQGTHK